MTDDQVPAGVGRTAIGMARVRAQESRRPDRLFDDPYAEAFVAAAPSAFPQEHGASGELASWGATISLQGIIRTRFFDEYLLAACAAACRQVVLLAAGLDTRAFRLALPTGVRLFELDLPEVLDFKERVLATQEAVPQCERTVLGVDLRQDWPAELAGAGFEPSAPAAWLAEGLLIYLSAEEAAHLLTAVGELSAPGSQLAFEHRTSADTRLLDQARAIPALAEVTAMWKGGLGEAAPDWLTRHGWQPRSHDRAALGAAYGRAVTGPSTGGFLTAVRGRTADR
jgi:methyltransferase (TIGR00027 family)